MYFNKLAYIANEYNNRCHRNIKKNPVDVKSSTCVDFDKESNKEDCKFEVVDHVRISKYKNIFVKSYSLNWHEEVFVIKKVKNTAPWTYVLEDLNIEEIVWMFYEIELQITNQAKFRDEKVTKIKQNKLYNKWKRYDSS